MNEQVKNDAGKTTGQPIVDIGNVKFESTTKVDSKVEDYSNNAFGGHGFGGQGGAGGNVNVTINNPPAPTPASASVSASLSANVGPVGAQQSGFQRFLSNVNSFGKTVLLYTGIGVVGAGAVDLYNNGENGVVGGLLGKTADKTELKVDAPDVNVRVSTGKSPITLKDVGEMLEKQHRADSIAFHQPAAPPADTTRGPGF